jgi:Arc/MetJ family transcription regulator
VGINVVVDQALVEEARRLTGLENANDAVEAVLKRVVAGRRKNKDLLDLVGKVEFAPDYDPEALRS